MKLFGSVYIARAYIDGLMDRVKATASELFFQQIDWLLSERLWSERPLSGRILCTGHHGRLLAFHAELVEWRECVSVLFKVGVTMCFILSPAIIVVRPLDLEDQIILFTQCDFDILVCVEENSGELVSTRRVFAVVVNKRFFSRCILEYNLPSLVECNTELSIAESDTSLAQEDIADLWITSEHKAFVKILRLVVKDET